MNTYDSYAPRTFSRSADRALLGGVCAGFAEYFGLNLRVIRLLAVIAFIIAMPMAVIVYVAIVLLVPARASTGDAARRSKKTWRESRRQGRAERRQSRADRKRARKDAKHGTSSAASEAAGQVRARCESLEQRLASLEKYITSSRYQLDKEISRL